MVKPSRWNGEKGYQIVKAMLSQKEPIGQIARRHQVSERLIYRWRDKFFEGGKAALEFDGRNAGQGEKAGLERQIEDLQKLIGEQAIEMLVTQCREWGAATLLTSWEEGTGSPRPFYERLGFAPTGRIVDGETEGRLAFA